MYVGHCLCAIQEDDQQTDHLTCDFSRNWLLNEIFAIQLTIVNRNFPISSCWNLPKGFGQKGWLWPSWHHHCIFSAQLSPPETKAKLENSIKGSWVDGIVQLTQITCNKKLTSLGKPIFTKLATSDSLNGSPEAACGWAGVGAEELEEPAFGSEVSMLCSAADLGWGNVTSGPSVLCFIFLISPASRSFCLLCFIFLISPASRDYFPFVTSQELPLAACLQGCRPLWRRLSKPPPHPLPQILPQTACDMVSLDNLRLHI